MSAWVLVTGGAQRLGREIALAFARGGWNVVCHYRHSATEAAALCEELRSSGVQAATVRGALDDEHGATGVFASALNAAGGALACVVNNAAMFAPDTGTGFSEAAMLAQLKTNLLVPLVLARLLHGATAAATSTAAGQASVIHLLDQKVFNLNPDYFSYTLGKLALERAVAQQAQALAPAVRVNGVAPGLMYESGPQSAENFAVASQANLLRRPIDPAQVAQAVFFLATNPAVTGVSLAVDNGQHLVPTARDIMFVVDELIAGVRP